MRAKTRSPEEQIARGQCRHIVHVEGSYVKKVPGKKIFIGPCDRWPEGLTVDFQGWQDLLRFLRSDTTGIAA